MAGTDNAEEQLSEFQLLDGLVHFGRFFYLLVMT
jgi:hypothetical protein